MNNQQQKTAESELREIAEKAGITLRQLIEKFHLALIDDEKMRTRMLKQQEMEQQHMAGQLNILSYRNETLNNKLLTYRLERKVWWMNLQRTIIGWFKRSPKQPKP